MFSPARPGAADAYRRIGVETSMHTVDQHQIVNLLFEGVLREIVRARGAIQRGDLTTKIDAISRALRILEEGLSTGLDRIDGGELAQNLSTLYNYCVRQLVLANARSDESLLQEVQSLLEPIAQSWKDIRAQALGQGAEQPAGFAPTMGQSAGQIAGSTGTGG
jgi:flagellar protein FliS